MGDVDTKKRLQKRLEELRQERQPWVEHWRDLVENVRPRTSRFLVTDAASAGLKKHGNIINGGPTVAARTLQGGMMAGITSPSRPWFRLGTPDASLSEVASVRTWLDDVEKEIRETLAKSNLYNGLHVLYGDLLLPGTAAIYIEEDLKRGILATVFPVGSYYAANGPDGRVDTVYRAFTMSTSNVVRKFSLAKCSASVQRLWSNGTREMAVQVAHAVEPRDIVTGELGAEGKPWASFWWEVDSGDDVGLLEESGYYENPCMVPRWTVTGEDVYGSSPGMDALGDCRALQHAEKRKAELIDKLTRPPMKGPSSLMNRKASILPGSMTYVDALGQGSTFSPAMEVNPAALTAIREEIAVLSRRVDQAFFADLWLLLSQSDGTMTAREVMERREEKLLQLGPVLERLNHELLDPLIDRIFGILLRRGQLPPPPEELAGQPLKVEYISIMAQAQKLLGTTQVERLVGFVTQTAQVTGPAILDKLDVDQVVDEYAQMLGVPPALVRSDDDVAKVRQQRGKAQQQQAQLEQAQAAVAAAKTASETDTSGDNALTEMLKGMGAR